jgi:four helix bundle protein
MGKSKIGNSMKINSYKDLIVWQKSFQLALEVYKITEKFPRQEMYGLTAQMRRSAVSIPSNIAEGYSRYYTKEYGQFLKTSFASAQELETQLLLSKELHYLIEEGFNRTHRLFTEVIKMLYSLIAKIH